MLLSGLGRYPHVFRKLAAQVFGKNRTGVRGIIWFPSINGFFANPPPASGQVIVNPLEAD
jgi:hypothetical protein